MLSFIEILKIIELYFLNIFINITAIKVNKIPL